MRDGVFDQAALIVICITIGLIAVIGGLTFLARLFM